jgi:hypothetical protein
MCGDCKRSQMPEFTACGGCGDFKPFCLAGEVESTTMADLSPMQRSILKWLVNWVRLVEERDPQSLKFGIAWEPVWTHKNQDKEQDRALENVWRASLCRSLARLEKRGLITRIKGRKNGRTHSVMLTREGRQVAESIDGN